MNELERLTTALASRYLLTTELGHGAMATVYLATDLKHDRAVALKVLKSSLAAEGASARFLREVRITARLNHPHILPLLDSGEAEGFLYYVMPWVEGETLRAKLAREKQLTVENALQIAREVGDALSYAHGHDVVHRDIKPENILLESSHAVVADFGIARALVAAGGEQLTRTGVAVGTPGYMSPEQATGCTDLDGRSDVYSLGCVLFEMLAGQPPFSGDVQSVVFQHLTADPPSITSIRPTVPASVAAALRRALSKSADDRFSSVALFSAALEGRESTSKGPAVSASVASMPRTIRRYAVPGIAGAVVLSAAALLLRSDDSGATKTVARHDRTAIAVLPFRNLNPEESHASLVAGLHDELSTQLSKVSALTVISRPSVMGYQDATIPLRQIGAELRVGSVLEGSVQLMGRRLRVHVQLIDVATHANLWSERYDRTIDDAFAIQADVAQQVAAAVGAALTSRERQGLAEIPTANPEAYRLYLQAREYLNRAGFFRRDYEAAQQLLERALALDPNFALGRATVSEVHGRMYHWRYDPSPARAARQRMEAESALRLAPTLPRAHIAMAMAHYWGRGDYSRALDEFAIALQGLPNDADLWQRIGWVQRRLGHWSEALTAFQKASELNPRDATLFADLGAASYLVMHRYADAVRANDIALSLAPDLHWAAVLKGFNYVLWLGQLDTLRTVLRALPNDTELGFLGTRAVQQIQLFRWQRQGDSLLHFLKAARTPVFVSQIEFFPSSLWAAWAHRLRGDTVAAKAAFDSARVLLDSVIADLPHDRRVHAARGLALAGLGRRSEALLEARWLQHSGGYRHDAFEGPRAAEDRARILAQAGETDAALDEIERLLTRPSWFSAQLLRLDPLWDRLRDHPRFIKLMAKHTRVE